MKVRGVIVLLILAASLLLMLTPGCKGPEGPTGPQGPAGSGVNMEGYKDSIKCGVCHTLDYDATYFVTSRIFQWQASKHANGGDYDRNASICAGCHTAEGFIRRMNGKPAIDILQPSPLGCFTCHSPHLRADFSLRTVTPVTIKSQITGVTDANFNYGPGNLCVQCHQTRNMTPKMVAPTDTSSTDSLRITTNRWYAHYGVQGQMLMGTGGFKFPGYTYNGNSSHTAAPVIQQEGCTVCHMATPVGGGAGRGGGHTMNLVYTAEGQEVELVTGCQTTGCHPSSFNTLNYNGVQTTVTTLLDSLFHMLGRRGWVDTVDTSPNYGLVQAGDGQSGNLPPLVIRPAIRAGALYNYYFVEHDLSEGVHNAQYAQDLLISSIQHLNNNP